MAKRTYTNDFRASALAALAANAGDVLRTARQLGIPETTLRHWAEGHRHPEARQMAEEKKRPLADRLEEIAHSLIDNMPAKMTVATLQQLTVSLGIAVEKMCLLREVPNAASETMADDERLARVVALLDAARARHAGSAPGAGPAPPAA